ncbi:hypothetical protein K7432_005064 [Basidiobolus ranarum]|uniref:Uncharacterized protein n=1 Tax=Basidiobolus ranarum TaxID=34480 RepID=A0ABR2WX93_9FUNG
MSSMTNGSVIRGNSTHESSNAQPSSSRITVQIPPEFRRSVPSISAELQNAGEKIRPMTFFGLDISEDINMSLPPQNFNSLPKPLSIEKEALAEDMEGRNNIGNVEKTDAGFGSYRIPRGSLYFLFGFLFMPVWWYGAIFPKHTDLKVDLRWRSYNRMMSIISVIILAIGLGMLIWFLSK